MLAADASPLLDVVACLLGRLVALAGVARRQLDVLLGGDARLQLASALQLGVELRAEQQRDVRDPQPQQEDDDAGQRPVRAVVVGEVGDVEAEDHRRDDEDEDRQQRAEADPAELRLLRVGGGVVEDRDHHDDDRREHRPFDDLPHGRGDLPEAECRPDGVGHRPRHDEDHQGDDDQRHADQRDEDLRRLELPERPAFLDLVDAVHGAAEGAHVARGRPDRQRQAQDEPPARGGGVRRLLERASQGVGRIGGDGVDDADDLVGGLAAAADQPEDREDRDQPRKDRQHRVVGQGCGDVGALVGRELACGLDEDVLPGSLLDLSRGVGLVGMLGIRCAPVIEFVVRRGHDLSDSF